MEILHILAGPVVGAVIGYCTNWVAVKMLFKPLYPVKFFGKTLPFTPGVIPKNMTRIGRACGQAISESLLTSEDMTAAFAKEETKSRVADKLYEKLFAKVTSENTTISKLTKNSETAENAEVSQSSEFTAASKVIQNSAVAENAEALQNSTYTENAGATASAADSKSSGLCINSVGNEFLGESGMTGAKQRAADFLTEKISSALQNADYEKAIADIGGRFIREKLNNPMISMFLNESVIASFAGPLAESIRGYIAASSEQMIRQMVEPEIEKLCDMPVTEMLGLSRETTDSSLQPDTDMSAMSAYPDSNNIDNLAEDTIKAVDSGIVTSTVKANINVCECAEDTSGEFAFDEDSAKQLIGRIYEKCVEKAALLILAELDIAAIVEEKIAAMDVKNFEELVLSVMKTELDYVVRLGALIGFIIGIINVFI